MFVWLVSSKYHINTILLLAIFDIFSMTAILAKKEQASINGDTIKVSTLWFNKSNKIFEGASDLFLLQNYSLVP